MLKKADIMLIGSVLVIALAALGFMYLNRSHGGEAVVYVDGVKSESYPLNKDTRVVLDGYIGGENVMEIKDGVVTITEADCPDKLCVYQADIQYNGQTLVCLPHRIVVRIENGRDSDIDGLAG